MVRPGMCHHALVLWSMIVLRLRSASRMMSLAVQGINSTVGGEVS